MTADHLWHQRRQNQREQNKQNYSRWLNERCKTLSRDINHALFADEKPSERTIIINLDDLFVWVILTVSILYIGGQLLRWWIQ